jgi:hypothetical protein
MPTLEASRFDKIKALFDALDTDFQPVEAAIYASEALFNVRHASLQIVQIFRHALDRATDRPQVLKHKILDSIRHAFDDGGDSLSRQDRSRGACRFPQRSGVWAFCRRASLCRLFPRLEFRHGDYTLTIFLEAARPGNSLILDLLVGVA